MRRNLSTDVKLVLIGLAGLVLLVLVRACEML